MNIRLVWTILPGVCLGIEHSLAVNHGRRVIERWVIHCFLISLRVHKFFADGEPLDKAPHDHPWHFWLTFPLQTYQEWVPSAGGMMLRTVKAWRPHFRLGSMQHIFVTPEKDDVWTLVLSGPTIRNWGFWKSPTEFIPHNEYNRATNSRKET